MEKKFIRATHCGNDGNAYRYQSGRQILDEALIDGHYLLRYRNAFGQIMPEMHMHSEVILSNARRAQAASAFCLRVDGREVDGRWREEGFKRIDDESGLHDEGQMWALRLVDDVEQVAVTVLTRLNGTDFIARALKIENLSARPIALTRVSPVAGIIWSIPHCPESCSEDKEFSIAYNHLQQQLCEGDFYFDEIHPFLNDVCQTELGMGITVLGDTGKSGWQRPACWLRNNLNGETLVMEYAWSGNWMLHAHVERYAPQATLIAEMGMPYMDGEVLRVLMPGESVVTPSVHFALLRESDDAIVAHTHDYVRKTILPPLPEGVPISEIEANHRGYLCDRESEEGIKADIDVAAAIGVEMYVVDAGWYGVKEPNRWWLNVGDWVAGPWMKNGFKPIPDYAHKKGMRFGLWIEIEALGDNCEKRMERPDWIMRRHGVECAIAGREGKYTTRGGRALNLADPAVEEYAYQIIAEAVEQYDLDMYRIDHNHDICIGGTREIGGYTENTLWRYYEAFERIFRRLRAKYPRLVLQNCASGGGRLDWGTMSLFHNVELSDWMRQPRDVRILSGVTMSLPPEILLRTVGTEAGNLSMDGDIDAQFRVSMICRPIYRGVAPALEALTPYLGEKMRAYNQLYKQFMRPLMKDCDVFHHTPFQPIMEPSAHTILEYAKKDRSAAMIVDFAQTTQGAGRNIIYPRGIHRGYEYKVTFLNSGEQVFMRGMDICTHGIAVYLGQTMGSEMVLFERV